MDDNTTINLILSRLPRKPLLSAREVADAALVDTRTVAAAMEEGKIAAAKVGRQYLISRAEAERWIRSKGVRP